MKGLEERKKYLNFFFITRRHSGNERIENRDKGWEILGSLYQTPQHTRNLFEMLEKIWNFKNQGYLPNSRRR